MSDLTAKFTALETQLTTQHGELKTRLDNIITKLGTINTTLTNNGAFDTTPIVNAINDLRGIGPENTIQSVNQSLWNIAGPTPGKSLADLYALWNPGAGITPYNLLDSIYLAIQNMYALWNPGAGITPYNLLDSIYLAITANGITEADAKAILVRIIAQFDSSVVYPTVKDLLMTISAQQAQLVALAGDPLTTIPVDICESPLVSTGRSYVDVTILNTTPYTVATWPEIPGGDFETTYTITTQSYAQISCPDWTQYRVYVASNAEYFGIGMLNFEKFPTNQWVSFAIFGWGLFDRIEFQVQRDADLTVYVCGAGAPALGSCSPAAQDPISVFAFSRHLYVPDPPFVTWYPSAMSGGNTWSNIVDIVIDGTNTVRGIVITAGGSELEMCLAWNTSNNATITKVGLHAYSEGDPGDYSIISYTGAEIYISALGDIASVNFSIADLNLAPHGISSVIFVPFLAISDADTPLSVAYSLSWLPPGWNAS